MLFIKKLFLQFRNTNSGQKNIRRYLFLSHSILTPELEHYGWWVWMGGILDGWKLAWALRPKGWVVNGTCSTWRTVVIFSRPLLSNTFYSGLEERSEFIFRGHLVGAWSHSSWSHGHFQEHQSGWRDGLAGTLRNKIKTIAKLYSMNIWKPCSGTSCGAALWRGQWWI